MAEAKNIYVYGGVDYSKWEEATLQLISEYYNSSLYDPQAKDKFQTEYPEYQASILESTKARGVGARNETGSELDGPGVGSYGEANIVLDANKTNAYMSRFRRGGLLTGVNPQYYERYRASGLSTSDKLVRGVFGGLFDESYQFDFDAKIKNKPSGWENGVLKSAGSGPGSATVARSENAGISLITLHVLEYLRRKYIELALKASASGPEGDELSVPSESITNIIDAVRELYLVYQKLNPLLNPGGSSNWLPEPPPFQRNDRGREQQLTTRYNNLKDRAIKNADRFTAGLMLIDDTLVDYDDPNLLNTSLVEIGGFEIDLKDSYKGDPYTSGGLPYGAFDNAEVSRRYGVILAVNTIGNPNYDVNVAVLNLFEFFRPRIDEVFTGDNERYGGTDSERIEREFNYILGFFNAIDPNDLEDNPLQGSDVTDISDPDALSGPLMPAPNLKPFDFQCFLLENISKLQNLRTTDDRYKADYKNLIRIDSNGDPGLVQNKIHAGGHDNASVKELLDICPDAYGLLTPYLKLSRIEYDDKGKIKIKDGKPVVKDLSIPNFLTENQLKDLLSPRGGRVPGAGIKSFSWSLDGVQPAEVDNNITAELVMYFQSVNDFFNGARQAGAEQPNFLDLIINSPRVEELQNKGSDKDKDKKKPDEKSCPDKLKKKVESRNYEGKNFRVQITAGWSTPDSESFVAMGMPSGKANSLVKAIRASKTTLYLQMVKHQINFAQNGSLELSISYRASLAGVLSGKTSNIFDDTGKRYKESIDNIKDQIDEIEKEATDSDTQKTRSNRKEKIKTLQQEIKTLRAQDRNVKYKKLLSKLFNTGVYKKQQPTSSTKIFSLSVNPYELSLEPYSELTPTQRSARIKRKTSSETFTTSQITNIHSELISSLNINKSDSGEDLSNKVAEAEYKRFQELAKQNRVNIPYFYLGDLFDAVLEQIKENYPEELGPDGLNFKFLLSDVEMIDPLQAFKVQNLEELIDCGYSLRDVARAAIQIETEPESFSDLAGIFKTMNIGDIPISLDTFQVWFKNNVIKSERDKYFFLYFVKDVCKDLISTALSSKCFGDDFKFEQRFDAKPLTIKTLKGGKTRFSPSKVHTISDVAAARNSIYESANPLNTELALILYSTDSKPHNLTGKPEIDIPNGVYHHYLGSACGLVKTLNFQREDQAYLRESRIQKQGALGAEQLRELYSVNMDLVGNNLYTNGAYIYVNPSLMNASKQYLDYLGLHGYYLVTKVQSKVTPSSFDVSIRALQEGISFDHQTLQPSRVTVEEPSRPEDPPPEFFESQPIPEDVYVPPEREREVYIGDA